MHQPHPSIYDVVIAGAGPVGLFLACELRLLDLSVLVLERAENPHSPFKRLPFGMRGLSAPTLEAFYRRGLLDELVAAQHANDDAGKTAAAAHWRQQPRRPAGHFAGIQFYHDDVDTSKWPYRLPSPADTSMAVTLETLETVLARRASAMGAEIRRGIGVDGFLASEAGVAVHADGETFHGRWLVGCDGGRSSIRKAGGFEFVGTDPEFTGYSAEVEMADPQALRPGRHYTPAGMYTYAPPGTVAMVEFDGGALHRIQPITLEHVQAVLRRVSGTDVTLTGLRLHLDGSRLSGDNLLPSTGAARRRCRAHPFAPGRPGTQSRARRRDEPGLEAGVDNPRRRATRPARELSAGAASGGSTGSRLVARASRTHAAHPEHARARSHHP
jgi:2-polyprenyl-6-methoxyphenol hydroxylase-like FAD-dependent oxidoreductase